MAKKATAAAEKVETKKTATTALTVKEDKGLVAASLNSSSLAQYADFDKSAFDGVGLDVSENKEIFNNDILIPKIWLTQAMSDHRKSHDIKEGTFVDSQNLDVFTEPGGLIRFVVLKTFKRWHTFELIKKGNEIKKEFISSEIMVLGKNENLKYQETVEGKDIVRRQVISAYVLLERDAKAGVNKPYIIDFASSSKGAGRVMISDIATLNNAKLPALCGFFEMSAEEESFDDNVAWVKKIKFGGYTAKEAIPFLVECYKTLATIENQIIIDDRDVITGKDEGAQAETKVTGKANVASAKI
jgi:hypothetical protein